MWQPSFCEETGSETERDLSARNTHVVFIMATRLELTKSRVIYRWRMIYWCQCCVNSCVCLAVLSGGLAVGERSFTHCSEALDDDGVPGYTSIDTDLPRFVSLLHSKQQLAQAWHALGRKSLENETTLQQSTVNRVFLL